MATTDIDLQWPMRDGFVRNVYIINLHFIDYVKSNLKKQNMISFTKYNKYK